VSALASAPRRGRRARGGTPSGGTLARSLAPPRAAPPGRRPRRGNPEGTRERLVATAAEVLNRDGYFGTDSNALARAACYSPATFYKHFADKREILLAAYESWVAAEWRHIGDVLRGESSPTEPRSRETSAERSRRRRGDRGAAVGRLAEELTDWILAHHRRWRGLRASVLALVGSDPVVREFYVAQRRNQLELLEGMRRPGRSARGDREGDALLLFTFERACDALANGEAEALGLRAAPLRSLLVRLLTARLAR
jgi:AcrR family transcriptional regulator